MNFPLKPTTNNFNVSITNFVNRSNYKLVIYMLKTDYF